MRMQLMQRLFQEFVCLSNIASHTRTLMSLLITLVQQKGSSLCQWLALNLLCQLDAVLF